MDPKKDFREFIELCLSAKVEFLVVGGFALLAHGAPRFTEDIDLLVAIPEENASKRLRRNKAASGRPHD